ncbi:biotin/lipoyl-containing protein [Chloroflexota bacterium]
MAQEVLEAPMAGTITTINVKLGDKVNEGDTLYILESMKMENPILTPVTGTVIEMNVFISQVVKAGEVVAIIEY